MIRDEKMGLPICYLHGYIAINERSEIEKKLS